MVLLSKKIDVKIKSLKLKMLHFDSIFSLFYLHQQKKWLYCTNVKYAYVYYKNKRYDCQKLQYEKIGFDYLLKKLNNQKITFCDPTTTSDRVIKVVHLFYEAPIDEKLKPESISEDGPLGIELVYEQSQIIDKNSIFFKDQEDEKIGKLRILESISWQKYKKKIAWIKNAIRDGLFYQINFTARFRYSFKTNNRKIFFTTFMKQWNLLSPYAHITYLGKMNIAYFCNSPECLFQVRNKNKDEYWLDSFPIKGTVKKSMGPETLMNSKKNEAELYMISDMIRNDMNKLNPPVAKIFHKKVLFSAPLLWHQMSWVSRRLDARHRLGWILRALFPGGSITGAPKKSAINTIASLEESPREYYCGATLLQWNKSMSCSLNIRSAKINFLDKTIEVGAGGGITLSSTAQSEWNEMHLKLKSFFTLWKTCE